MLVTSDNIAMVLDIAKYGVEEDGVIFTLITPPTYGTLTLDLLTTRTEHSFTLRDIDQDKVKNFLLYCRTTTNFFQMSIKCHTIDQSIYIRLIRREKKEENERRKSHTLFEFVIGPRAIDSSRHKDLTLEPWGGHVPCSCRHDSLGCLFLFYLHPIYPPTLSYL